MVLLLGICIGLILSGMCAVVRPLIDFIRGVDELENCSLCDTDKCILFKETHHGRSNIVTDWMIISYIMVRKRCRWSGKDIGYKDIIYAAVAFFLYISLFWSKGFDYIGALYGMTSVVLLFLSVVDWNTQYIPMECNVLIFIFGLIRLFADVSNWVEYLIGLIAVSGFLYMVDRISIPLIKKRYGNDITHAMGDGDIKLMAATGLLLGWKLNFLALGIGCITGSIIHLILMQVKKSDRQFAFGPYLSLGVYITMICGEQLVSWYLNVVGVYPIE